MSEDPYMFSDGGPLIVIPATAITWWDGCRDSENSLMEGGSVQTDYDVICSVDAGSVVRIRGTDILVGTDGEFGGALLVVENHLLLVQGLPHDEDLRPLVRRVLAGEPDDVAEMRIMEQELRLVGGADSGNGEVWGYRDERIVKVGSRLLRVFHDPGVELIVDFGSP